jgi:hypothetical protein
MKHKMMKMSLESVSTSQSLMEYNKILASWFKQAPIRVILLEQEVMLVLIDIQRTVGRDIFLSTPR